MIRKLMFGLFAVVALSVEAVTITSSGDYPWTNVDGVWTSADPASVSVVDNEYMTFASTLVLTVETPCVLTFDLGIKRLSGAYSRPSLSGSVSYGDSLYPQYVDLNWNYSSDVSKQRILLPGSGHCEVFIEASCWLPVDPQFPWVTVQLSNVSVQTMPEVCTVVFDARGGEVDESTRTYKTENRSYGSFPAVSRDGFSFLGWFSDAARTKRVNEDSAIDPEITCLYADWSIPLMDALGPCEGVSVSVDDYGYLEECDTWHGSADYSADSYGAAILKGGASGELCVTTEGKGVLSFKCSTIGSGGAWLNVRDCFSYDTVAQYELSNIDAENKEWASKSIVVLTDEHWCYAISGYVYGDAQALLVDAIEWTPAPEKMSLKLVTSPFEEPGKVECIPGDVFADRLPTPTRTGYIFGGWCLDATLTRDVSMDSLIPFEGARVFAKWCKSLAAASTLSLSNNPAAYSEVIYDTEYFNACEWQNVEEAYTTGENSLQVTLSGESGKCPYAVLETTVTGSCLLDFVWYLETYGINWVQTWLEIDGKKYSGCDLLAEGGSSERKTTVVLGSGTHKVRWYATTSPISSGSDSSAVVKLDELKTSSITSVSSLGEWLSRLTIGCWTQNNLSTLKSTYKTKMSQSDSTAKYRAAIEHALITLLAVGEDPLVASTCKQFGITLEYVDMSVKGKFDFAKLIAGNPLVDNAFNKAYPAINEALSDLAVIPDSWTGSLRFSADEYPIDEDISIDIGDIRYLKAALKGLLAAGNIAKAYNTQFDGKQFAEDTAGCPVVALDKQPDLLCDELDWPELYFSLTEYSCYDAVEGLSSKDFSRAKGGTFSLVRYGAKLYLRVPKEIAKSHLDISSAIPSIELKLSNGSPTANKKVTVSFVDESGFGGLGSYSMVDYVPISADFYDREEDMIWVFDCSGTDLAASPDIKYMMQIVLGFYGSTDGGIRELSAVYEGNRDYMLAAVNQRTMFDKVRDASALVKAKQLMDEALALAQRADDYIRYSRKSDDVFLVNYDDRDENAIVQTRSRIDAARAALTSPQYFDFEVEGFPSPLRLSLDALFSGKINQSLIPRTYNNYYYAPIIDRMVSPTLGGLVPDFTRETWVNVAERYGFVPRNEPIHVETIVPGQNVSIDTGCIGSAFTVAGLPTGLKFTAATGLITGVATKPTGVGGVEVAILQNKQPFNEFIMVVTDLPKVTVALTGDVSGCTVTGAGSYLANKKYTLTAKTPKGTAFCGWTCDGEPWPDKENSLKASVSAIMGLESLNLVATFEKEKMSVDCIGLSSGSFMVGVGLPIDGIPLEISTQSGVKSVAVSGLPTGTKYDAKSGLISGIPTKAGDYKAVITVTANSGAVEKKEIALTVAELPSDVAGTFNGFVYKNEEMVGTLQLTISAVGALSAKVTTSAGAITLTTKGWTKAFDSCYYANLITAKGDKMDLVLDLSVGPEEAEYSLTGALLFAAKPGIWYDVRAEQNIFATPWYLAAVGDADNGWVLTFAPDAKSAALTVVPAANGSVSISGKLGTYAVKTTAFVSVKGLRDGCLMIDSAPIITVGKEKKALSISTNLWLDRDNEAHIGDIGEAHFTE